MIFNCAVPVLIILCAIGLCQAKSGQDDLIDKLPGLAKQPSFKQYSGYLKAIGLKRLHYWFVESQSNPSKDPVVVWVNGGPFCSAMNSLLTDHGPFRINADGKTLTTNPYSWNMVANVIYLDAPAGVGFSYAIDKNISSSDKLTAANNLAALKDFFTKFPQFKSNDFYITGKGFAGRHIPILASDMFDDGDIKLKGFAVGNGLLDKRTGFNAAPINAYSHGLFGRSLLNKLNESCCAGNSSWQNCDFYWAVNNRRGCLILMGQVVDSIWNIGMNPFNLYADCAVTPSAQHQSDIGKIVSPHLLDFLPKNIQERKSLNSLPEVNNPWQLPCIDLGPITKYLNSSQVRAALHIPSVVPTWESCRTLRNDYYYSDKPMQPYYIKALANKLRMLVYNGDVDMLNSYLASEMFVESLPLTNPKTRELWFFTKNGSKYVAGFFKIYDYLTLVTIKGSGHLVGADKPIPALDLLTNFIQNKPF